MDNPGLYRKVNILTNQLRELQLKYDNQTVLLRQTEEELQDVKGQFRKLRADTIDRGESNDFQSMMERLRSEIETHKQENNQLNTSLEKSNYDKLELGQEVQELKGLLEESKSETQSQAARIEALQDSIEAVKVVAYQYEDENRQLLETVKKLQSAESELQLQLTAKEDILGSLAVEAKMIGKQKSDMNAARRETNRNRKQLLLLCESSNRTQMSLHSSLLSNKKLLQELKTMYEETAEISRAEMNSEREGLVRDYQKLQNKFEQLKLIQFEDKRQLLHEQREIVKALQTQFEEYRQTAEFLFETESRKLSDKLKSCTEKYEEEIKYIVRAKDEFYDMMMTAKDAKIMNLIEGSDLQTVLIRHEQELDQLRKSHLDDLERMRLKTEAEQRDTMAELRREIATHELTQEKLKGTIQQMENQLQEANSMGQKRLDQLSERDDAHMQELVNLQNLLQESHEVCERLNQEKQDLRHRIVRLKFKANGDADETLPNLVKRLSLETSSLKAKHAQITKRHEAAISTLKTLQQKYIIQSQHLESVTVMAQAKDKEVNDMVRTLSKVLYFRARSKFECGKQGTSEKRRAGKQEARRRDPNANMSFRGAIATLQQVLDGRGNNSWLDESIYDGATSLMESKGSEVITESEEGHPESSNVPMAKGPRPTASVKAKIPARLKKILGGNNGDDEEEVDRVDRAEVIELARGINYLRKFQQVSSSFAHGEFRLPMNLANKTYARGASGTDGSVYEQLNSLDVGGEITGAKDDLWKGVDLYGKLEREKGNILSVAARNQEILTQDRSGMLSPTHLQSNISVYEGEAVDQQQQRQKKSKADETAAWKTPKKKQAEKKTNKRAVKPTPPPPKFVVNGKPKKGK